MVVQTNDSVILKEPHTVCETADYDVSHFERYVPDPGARLKRHNCGERKDRCKRHADALKRNTAV